MTSSIRSHSIVVHAAVCLLLLAGICGHRLSTRTVNDAATYHARVKAAVDAIPFRLGDWAGEDIPVPSSATALLRPNALMARSYRNATDGRVISLVVVQCQDTRDMAGHYPPICFPAHGWTPRESELIPNIIEGGKRVMPINRYLYERSSAFEGSSRWVYNLILLPVQGAVEDMPDVRKAAANPQTRLRGAAQVQIMLSGDVPEADQVQFVREFLSGIDSVIEEIVQFEKQPPRS